MHRQTDRQTDEIAQRATLDESDADRHTDKKSVYHANVMTFTLGVQIMENFTIFDRHITGVDIYLPNKIQSDLIKMGDFDIAKKSNGYI